MRQSTCLSVVCFLSILVLSSHSILSQEKPSLSSLFQEETKSEEQSTPASDATKPDGSDSKPASTADVKSAPQAESTPSKTEVTSQSSESSGEQKKADAVQAPQTAKKQLRQLELSGNYQDHVQPLSFNPTDLILGGAPGKTKSFYRLCDYLTELGKDEQVTHVLFDLSDDVLSFNPAQLDELVRQLALMKAKGKKTIAWIENAGNGHIAIASQCDEIVMADFGGLDIPSAALETTFYRDAMDLIGVKASIVRAGDFKGAVEPYQNAKMSDHLREHYLKMLESINSAQVSRIAKGRGMTTAAVRDLQKKRMLLPAEALAAGLITKLAPYGSMKKTVQEMIGPEIEWTTPKSKPKREMSFFELMGKLMGGGPETSSKIKDNAIVVLHLQGAIVDGKQNEPGSIVAGPTVKVIEELIKDERVKGVVVRVNSPGGSATASEAIRQALAELAKKKPLVYSMGEMAASGGYWVTCIGQPIYAEHGTITGSIGVFSMKISLGTLMKRVGLHVESIALDPSAAMDAMDRAWSDEEIAEYQRFIDEVYNRFLSIASASRKLPVEKVKGLAGGRVWSGEQAKQAGLVDELGGVYDCITVVAKKAGIDEYKVVHRPEPTAGLGLLSMFEEPDDSQIRNSDAGMERGLIRSLERYGFRLEGLKAILRDAAASHGGLPKVWALVPTELNVR